MTGVSRQKQKLLTMKKLFETKTDEKHTITGNRLIEILGDYGIHIYPSMQSTNRFVIN